MLPLKDNNPTSTTPFVTYGLVIVNAVVMLWLSTFPPVAQQQFLIERGFIPARIAQLANPKLVVEVPIESDVVVQNGRIVRRPIKTVALKAATMPILASLLTSMFIHGGWLHLAGNMWFLWIFGNNIEDRLGHLLYLVFYLVGGVLASASHWAYNPQSAIPVVGASGAVATILGAYAVTFPKATVSTLVFFGFITIIEVPALVWLAVWIGGQLLDALLQRDMGVAVWAHIGGFAVGAVLMPLLSYVTGPRGGSLEDELKKYFPFLESHER
jgi:rhomboid family protein